EGRDPSRATPLSAAPPLPPLRHDEELPRRGTRGVPVVVAVQRLHVESRLGKEQLGLAPVEIVEARRTGDPVHGAVVGALVEHDALRDAIDVRSARRELPYRAACFGVLPLPLIDHAAVLSDDQLGIGLEDVHREAATRSEMFADAREARPTVVRREHQERVEPDEDEAERLVEREGAHVALDPADLDVRATRATFGTFEHRRGPVESNDVMTILRERHGDATGAAAELEDRPPRPPVEPA